MNRFTAAMVVVILSGCPSPGPVCDAGECDDAGSLGGGAGGGAGDGSVGGGGGSVGGGVGGGGGSASGGGGGSTTGGGGGSTTGGGGGSATGGGGGSATGGGGGCSTSQLPVATITACTATQLMTDPDCLQGATMSVAYNHSMISPMSIALSAASSTGIASTSEYRFVMLPPIPGGATTMSMRNNGQRTTQPMTELTVPSSVSGTFRIGLEVWDACGMKSANTDVIAVNISP